MKEARYIPAGWPALIPRIFVDAPERLVDFITQVFGATGSFHPERPSELRIGDSILMVSASTERGPFAAFLYVYVEDTDATYRRALESGATSLESPRDRRTATAGHGATPARTVSTRMTPRERASGSCPGSGRFDATSRRRARAEIEPFEMIEYRPAKPSDAESIASLHARSWRENYRGSFRDAFLDGDLVGERLRVWRERLERPSDDQLVQLAVDGANLVGFVCAYAAHDPHWGSFVDNLHVAHASKGNGIGSSLMRQVGAWLASLHPEMGVYLWVLESNSSARRFYERLGARDAGVSMMEAHGGAVVRSCRYTWPRAAALTDRGRPS